MTTRKILPFAKGASVAATLALTALPASAQEFDFSTMDEPQREAFGEAVRDYLMENPQVIMEAVAVLEQREQQQAAARDSDLVADHEEALLNDGYSWIGGNPEGDVTVVEFFDYRCGYCRRATPEVEELIASDGNIRIILKEFPILGEASMTSARFAIATKIVGGDEAYKQVHDSLIALEGAPDQTALTRLADTLGLDGEAIIAEMGSPEVTRRIAETRALAQSMQISGTPTFIFGDEMVRGYLPLDGMREVVDEVRGEG